VIDALVLKVVKAYGFTGSAGLFAIAGFGAGIWLVASAWLNTHGEAYINETKIRLYEAELKRLKLTAAEREALMVASIELNAMNGFEESHSWTLRKLLERMA
jgi:hypothetical protein